MKRLVFTALIGAGLAMLAGCAGAVPDSASDGGVQQVAASATLTPTWTPVPDEAPPTDTEEAQPQSPPEPSATPTVRPGLEATDPASVDLASGKPTLLEFFAFW